MSATEATPGWWSSHIELLATIVLSLSAILTAWSAFQASQWNSEGSQANTRSSAARVESTRFDILAGQDRAVDVSVFAAFVDAVNTDMRDGLVELVPGVRYEPIPGTLSGFIYQRVRPEFRPAFDAWLMAFANEGDTAPPTPFAMPEYQLANAERANQLLDDVQMHAAAYQEASNNASNYLLTTLGFALVIFLGGVSTKLDKDVSKRVALAFAGLLFFVGAVIVILQPRVAIF